MRIAQILLPGASQYERKSQRIDAAMLEGAELVDDARGFDVAHVYGPPTLPRPRVGVPYLANATMPRRWWQTRLAQPELVVAPVADETHTLLPEAVDESFFAGARDEAEQYPVEGRDDAVTHHTVGVFVRASVKNVIEQTMHRLARTRDDITWHLFDEPPSPAEMAKVTVWVDPAIDIHDYDGFTAEALAAGCVIVASRTLVNLQRTEKGRTALLVPPNDPNELTHAILAALFKSEAGQQRAIAARQTISKFRPRQRLRVLAALYETLLQ